MNELKRNLFDEVNNLLPTDNWKEIYINCHFSKSKYGLRIKYLDENDQLNDFPVSSRYFKKFKNDIYIIYQSKFENLEERFNKLDFIVYKDYSFKETFYWDKSKEKGEKIMAAKFFYQWINETLMNRIFDYEKENGLLTPNYDEDGDLIDYENSWENGEFNFNIIEDKVEYMIKLTKDGETRNLDMLLPEYVKIGLLEHHKMTNQELKDKWKPWDKLRIKSPHNTIPYDKWTDFVNYSI